MSTVATAIARRHRGFTLVEMLTVITILIALMATGLPALVMAQKRADEAETNNLIAGVHGTVQRLARQYSSANTIYGFSLAYDDNASVSGVHTAARITPWVIVNNAVGLEPGTSLADEIGRKDLWNGSGIDLIDNKRPGGSAIVNGASTTVTAAHWLHIAYEPRTGFPHALVNTTPAGSLGAAFADITKPSELPSTVHIPIWGRTGQSRAFVVIFSSGVCNAHAAP